MAGPYPEPPHTLQSFCCIWALSTGALSTVEGLWGLLALKEVEEDEAAAWSGPTMAAAHEFTVEARNLEHHDPPTLKPREEADHRSTRRLRAEEFQGHSFSKASRFHSEFWVLWPRSDTHRWNLVALNNSTRTQPQLLSVIQAIRA